MFKRGGRHLIRKGLRVTAGIAYCKRGVIAASNRVLLDEASIRVTLAHGYAHLEGVEAAMCS